jgi:hypothetical protein
LQCRGYQTEEFFSIALIAAALTSEGKQDVELLRTSSTQYAQRYCNSSQSDPAKAHQFAIDRDSSNPNGSFDWLKFRMLTARLPYLFWPSPKEPFRFGTARDGAGRIVPLIDIRSAATILERETTPTSIYGDPEFCRLIRDFNPVPLSCEAVRGRVVIIGASHVDNRDNYATPLGVMAGVYVIANTIAGARETLLSEPTLTNNASLWGIVLFAIFAILASRVRNMLAIVLGVAVAIAFLSFFSGALGIPTSTAYQSINLSIVLLAIFLT